MNSGIFYNGYHLQKVKDCNRFQRNASQDIYVPMEGQICSGRLANGTYENYDVLCHICHAYKRNDYKKLHSTLSQDIMSLMKLVIIL